MEDKASGKKPVIEDEQLEEDKLSMKKPPMEDEQPVEDKPSVKKPVTEDEQLVEDHSSVKKSAMKDELVPLKLSATEDISVRGELEPPLLEPANFTPDNDPFRNRENLTRRRKQMSSFLTLTAGRRVLSEPEFLNFYEPMNRFLGSLKVSKFGLGVQETWHKQLIEMHGFYYDFQATLSATVCYCITTDQTLSLHFISEVVLLLWIFFNDNARIKGK